MAPTPVYLHVYDLSQGLARQLSPMLLGRTIDAIYHSAVVVAGKEFYFGGMGGINSAPAGRTRFGTPVEVRSIGGSL